MDVFLEELQKNEGLQEYIRCFVPNTAKADPSHAFWKIVPYSSLQRNDFDYCKFLFWASQSNEKYGHYLNVFSRLSRAYRYYHPEVQCTSRYEDMFDVYLDAISDCFDGPEVIKLVEQIVEKSLQFSSKAKRAKYAKAEVAAAFHAENRKRPRWIQGPEWPMGTYSPMAFIAQKKAGDSVHYEFKDVDTGDMRVIEQYY
jgi:hypothetical protein